MCISCGLCASLMGPHKIEMAVSDHKELRPRVAGTLTNNDFTKVQRVCPGVRIEGPELQTTPVNGEKTDLVWGPYLRMVHAHASNSTHRWEGSTGGVLTALATMLLRTGKVAFVLHVKASDSNPTFGVSTMSFTEADVLQAAGSRYGPAAPLSRLAQALEMDQSFAFIGRPCDVSAIGNLAEFDERVARLIVFRLAFVCGGPTPSLDIDRMIARAGVNPEQVVEMRYRGRGCPGPTAITTADGNTVYKRYSDFLNTDGRTWPMHFRCKICPDGIGERADIAVSDTWPGGVPDPTIGDADSGTNAMIVRTLKGLELVQEADAAGFLTLGNDFGPEGMDLYQPHQRDKKYAAWARIRGLRGAGRLFPHTKRLRLRDLASRMPREFNAEQSRGTKDRSQALVPEHIDLSYFKAPDVSLSRTVQEEK
ncbi:coenzyme F420 hydrogenase/dehydrogenase subunit beta domain-containing protein (plasmid) [Rhizobium gallicum]|uniref:Coenzyme F420 hydrogenase/dehydrogenase subunit beta domain-containing protein n=2 Tax=Rhizobium gallicum TaxID=56730 RepID=A0A1L5NPL2_9HYPH|nr:coenzyme F420 hydrogenase/dehydrogenase subunit beta domain-containing protein [Rhizobium gallicum]